MSINQKLKNDDFDEKELVTWLNSQNPVLIFETCKKIIALNLQSPALLSALFALGREMNQENQLFGMYRTAI